MLDPLCPSRTELPCPHPDQQHAHILIEKVQKPSHKRYIVAQPWGYHHQCIIHPLWYSKRRRFETHAGKEEFIETRLAHRDGNAHPLHKISAQLYEMWARITKAWYNDFVLNFFGYFFDDLCISSAHVVFISKTETPTQNSPEVCVVVKLFRCRLCGGNVKVEITEKTAQVKFLITRPGRKPQKFIVYISGPSKSSPMWH